MSAWYLIIITYYAGAQPVEFDSQAACIEAREVIKENNPGGWAMRSVCVRKGK